MAEDINARDEAGATRLFEAVSDDDFDEADRLLSLGADPDIPEANGITPLMDAASGGSEEMVLLLLQRGADPNALDNYGDSAADYAREQGFPELAAIIERNSDPDSLRRARREREDRLTREEREVAEIVRNLPESRETDVWYASADGERIGIAASEEEARAMWEGLCGASLVLDMKHEVVGVVEGVARNWGTSEEPVPHVTWACPACGERHDADLCGGETNPSLWYCANGFGRAKFWVRWHTQETSRPSRPTGRGGDSASPPD